jgi:hypothetical protein
MLADAPLLRLLQMKSHCRSELIKNACCMRRCAVCTDKSALMHQGTAGYARGSARWVQRACGIWPSTDTRKFSCTTKTEGEALVYMRALWALHRSEILVMRKSRSQAQNHALKMQIHAQTRPRFTFCARQLSSNDSKLASDLRKRGMHPLSVNSGARTTTNYHMCTSTRKPLRRTGFVSNQQFSQHCSTDRYLEHFFMMACYSEHETVLLESSPGECTQDNGKQATATIPVQHARCRRIHYLWQAV